MRGREGEFEGADRLLGEPSLGLLGNVRGMIIEDQLDRGMDRIGGVEKLKKFDEFSTAVATSTRARTWPVSRSIPASKLTVRLRLYS